MACVPRRFHEEKAPWRHHERYSPDYEDHGIGDTARRNAGADYLHQFGKGRRTQNMPEDYGTTRTPEPFDRTRSMVTKAHGSLRQIVAVRAELARLSNGSIADPARVCTIHVRTRRAEWGRTRQCDG
ncbi:MAG TPA: hypothetical protein VN630_08115 [Rhodanobacteraceae bacterium]|nr:hypothetical protein [Rhodanobacteraceae bacterium]